MIGRLPTGRAGRLLDVAAVVWVVAWLALGVATGVQVRELRGNADLVIRVGEAIETTGEALDALASVPLVGGQVRGVADQVQAAADRILESGRDNRESASRLSWMLGLAIAVIPSVPLFGLYLPLRVTAARDRRALQRLLGAGLPSETLDRVLADRALSTLPYEHLLAVADDPWGDFAAGRHAALAQAELDRHGLTRPG